MGRPRPYTARTRVRKGVGERGYPGPILRPVASDPRRPGGDHEGGGGDPAGGRDHRTGGLRRRDRGASTTGGDHHHRLRPRHDLSPPSPADLGDQIGALYLAAYDDLIALLADRPDAATAAAALSDLKEQYVQEMVALGHQREALDAADRATVDARITAALGGLPTATYDAYQQAYTDYGSDLEVANLIASFNILGQYANFDLLRQQAPEEAERLGIG